MARPIKTFEEFVGQPRLVRHLKRLVAGFHQLTKPLPHLLLLAPTGFGKTVLAEALTTSVRTRIHPVVACTKLRPQDLYDVLRQVNFGDVLFIDEAHSLQPDAQQALFTAIDRCKIPAIAENGRPGAVVNSIAEFTLILATNYPGEIRRALRNRVTPLSFDRYSTDELKAIAQRIATHESIHLSAQAARRIAETAQGTPRLVNQHLGNLRHYSPNAAEYTLAIVREYLESVGIDAAGLSPVQRNYLHTLAAMPKQRCRLDHLAVRLGLDARYIREEAEYFLVERGYVEVLSHSARRLTQHGHELLQTLSS